jgi:predicted Zn-dependent peptidase
MKDQAYALAWYETLGLGVDFADRYADEVGAVTAEDVQEAASRLQHLVLAVMVPEENQGSGGQSRTPAPEP